MILRPVFLVRLLPLVLMVPVAARSKEPQHALFGNSIRLAEAALDRRGDELVGQVDEVLASRIDQIDGTVTEALDQADHIVDGAIGDADLVLAARIAQIDASANALVANSLGGLDTLSRQTIERATAGAGRVVEDVDRRVVQRIDQIDARLEARLAQVDDAVQAAIDSSDEALETRIAQADESLERRIGNVDVLVSKQTLLIEGSLLKIASLLATLAMIVFGVWPAVRDQFARREARADVPALTWRGLGVWWGGRACFAASVALLLAMGARYLPLGSRLEVDRLKQAHAAGMSAAVDVLDLPRVRYHASQLAILDPAGQWCAERTLLETQLLAHVYEPGASRAEVERDLEQLQRWRPRGGSDPLYPLHEAERWFLRWTGAEVPPPDCGSDDVLLAETYFRWREAEGRDERLAAAAALAEVLEQIPSTVRFQRVAWLALDQTLSGPVPGISPEVLARITGERPAEPGSEEPRLEAREQFARLRMALADEVAPARVALLEAQAAVAGSAGTAGVEEARLQRTAAAERIVEAFRVFDEGLQRLAPAVAVEALAVDDAPLVQALWYAEHPETHALAPLLRTAPDPEVRARVAPLRIAWTRRYVAPLPMRLRQILGHQQAQRFVQDEAAARELLEDWVALARRPEEADLAVRVACRAARAGLYRIEAGRQIPVTAAILPHDPDGATSCGDGSTVRSRFAAATAG